MTRIAGATITTFYAFAALDGLPAMQAALKSFKLSRNIRGTTLLAPEGINGTVSGNRDDVDAYLAMLRSDSRFADMDHKESRFPSQPFQRTKVKIKPELISLGVPAHPEKKVGRYVHPKDWNALLADPDMIVIDARNAYEVHLGSFKGAANPETRTFKQLPDYVKKTLDPAKHKKIAMYCTGGIRCEKFSAYMLDQGFEQVYHLKGGILKYLEDIPKAQSAWQGACFVFDERIGVTHALEPVPGLALCGGCGHSLTAEDREDPEFIEGTRCAFCP